MFLKKNLTNLALSFIMLLAVIITGAMTTSFKQSKPKGTPVPTITAFLAKGSVTPSSTPTRTPTATITNTVTLTSTETAIPDTATLGATLTESATPTDTLTPTATSTPTETPTTVPGSTTLPHLGAALCPDHDTSTFHTLWDYERDCHYDHEHGTNPFTPEVAAAFPGFDLFALLGNREVGTTNPTSAMENTMKHGGFKWNVMLENPHGCLAGFEDAVYCVYKLVIEFHGFGDANMELETARHSSVALLTECDPQNTSDCGTLFVAQPQNYGQRITPYQGTIIPYPNSPVPSYDPASGQYWSIDCIGAVIQCRSSIEFVVSRGLNSNSTVTSKPTGLNISTRPRASSILRILWTVRDNYQLFDFNDFTYPFTFVWLCTNDGGLTYNPVLCAYNNTTQKVHEVAGTIPASWDNLAGFDTNPTVGRITAEGFVDEFGTLNTLCSEAGGNCYPIKMENMFVGKFGDWTLLTKPSNNTPQTNPENDIYFCNGTLCNETVPGASPSGWVGANN